MSDVIQRAKDNYELDKSYWSEIYRKARDDMFFISDDENAQWEARDRAARDKRPCLTIDQLGQFIHKVANNIRMNTPTINVIPGDDGDPETAEVIKGIVKNIESKSNADEAYDTASLSSIRCSIGFFKIEHDYVREDGFEQELLIKRVVNPLSTWIDCDSIEVDGSDSRRAITIEPISVKEFKRRYPGKEVVSFGDEKTGAKDDDTLNIAEYYEIKSEEKEVGLTEGGEIEEAQEDAEYANKRTLKKIKIMKYILSGADILAQSVFPGKYIPIIPVYGEEAWIDGKRQLYSLIRKSKDAQRMYNYWKSLETELLMKQPNAPIMVGEGQIEDYKDDWLYPQKAMALRYKTHDIDGNPLPAPIRLAPPTIPTGIVNAARATVDDIKATMGLYNAAIGEQSNETSGIAITKRKEEGDVATYHFGDNLVKSIAHGGRIIVCALPEVADTPRMMRLIDEEEEPSQVGVNGLMAPDQKRHFDLRKGIYDIRVITGPSNVTKRQEAEDFLGQILTKDPQLMMIMGDLYFKYSDVAGAQVMAERMRKAINPKFLDDNNQEQPDPEKEQMKMVIQQGEQMLQQMQAQMADLEKQLKDKQGEIQIKAQGEQNKAGHEQGKLELELLKVHQEAQKIEKENEFKMAALQLKQRELDIKEADLMISAQQQEKKMTIDGQTQALTVSGQSELVSTNS